MSNRTPVQATPGQWIRGAAVVAIAAGLVGVACAVTDLEQFFQSYLLAFLIWWSVAVGCLGVLMMFHLVGGRWGQAARPFLESGSLTIPLMGLLFLPIAWSLGSLYEWTHEGAISDQKALYLNVPFFLVRAVLYFVIWTALALIVSPGGRTRRDESPRWLRLTSAGGLVLLVLTVTFAGIDWGMSLEPHWFSSIYGAVVLIGGGLSAMALASGTCSALEWSRPTAQTLFPEDIRADLATLMLAFLMLWAYFAFSQFLIIWSGNLPEENVWYVHRLRGGWQWWALAIVVFQFAIPFGLLLSRDIKRSARAMTLLATLVLVMHALELGWMILPAFHPDSLRLHVADVAVPTAVGGLWICLYLWFVRRRAVDFVAGETS